jgi:uridylate kinase
MSAIQMSGVVEHYDRRTAIRHLNAGDVVIFSAGTGNPFFTTDSAACLRGIEIDADLILKATKVDGVYSADPHTNPDAIKFDTLTFDEVIEKKLGVMDLTAIFLSRDHNVPIKVFNMNKPGALLENILGDTDGTLIQ